ncbi:ROK family protein [Alkalicoccus chagannorensis]|uniref:ROK family protein n=1 Tax=Alkalicoccus chagannorensis TaxID=427072 RepID=UPI000418829D|nr:ROK family protein [Alkalicoccus chagannorensis]
MTYLSFDIGGTDVKWGLLAEDGTIQEKHRFSSNQADGAHIYDEIRRIMMQYRGQAAGTALSAPGFIDPVSGYMHNAGAVSDFHGRNIRSSLEAETGLPVSIENDVNCAALAEHWLGRAQHVQHFVCMTIGTGIGGAVFIHGGLVRGHSYRSGEFGYMLLSGLQPGKPDDYSWNRTAGLFALRRQYAEIFHMPVRDVSGETVFAEADRGCVHASRLVQRFYATIAAGIYNISAVLNPPLVLIGGGMTERPAFLEELRQEYAFLDQTFLPDIELCHFRNDAGIVGALAHHLREASRPSSSSR